jgi:hypothetical protein
VSGVEEKTKGENVKKKKLQSRVWRRGYGGKAEMYVSMDN